MYWLDWTSNLALVFIICVLIVFSLLWCELQIFRILLCSSYVFIVYSISNIYVCTVTLVVYLVILFCLPKLYNLGRNVGPPLLVLFWVYVLNALIGCVALARARRLGSLRCNGLLKILLFSRPSDYIKW